jgi:tripartite-type tricarboxylate transporter receptor subunit TctC
MWRACLIILTAVFVTVSGTASSQVWPTKPIRVIVPFGAGSVADLVPRIVFNQLAAELGQPVIVENRPGAGSTIGTAVVATSEADGYTILASSSPFTITPSIYSHLSYNAAADFSAIIPLGVSPTVMVISPSKGFTTIQSFVEAAKRKYSSLTFASLGVGSATHMSEERFRLSAGFKAIHVPFKGAPEALTEVTAGRVDYFFCAIGTALPFIKDGKLRALVISTPKRLAILPDVPTTLEAGYQNSDYSFWMGLFAPAKTPTAVINGLHDAIAHALEAAAVQEKLAKLGVERLVMTPAEFDGYVKREITLNAHIAKAMGLKAN